MAARSRSTSEEKVLKVLLNESSDEKIAVVASTYQDFVEKCTKKLGHTDDSDFKVYTEDTTLLDEEYFRFIANESVVRLTPEKHLAFPPIAVRVTEKGNVYQFGEKNILVCINVTDKFVDFLGDVIDDIQNDEEILLTAKLSKEDEDAHRRFILSLKTQVTLKTKEVTREAEKMILKYLGGDHSRVLRSITEKFFIRYNAMLTSLSTGCLRLWFSFISENERRTMKQDIPSVEKMLRSMVLPPNLVKNPEIGFTILREEIRECTLPRSESGNENDQHSYKRGDDRFAQILKSLESRILRENSLECIYQTCRSFSDNLLVGDREDILYTVLCLDTSKSLRKGEFSAVRSCAIQYLKELDKSAQDSIRLDECVAILSFGDCLTNVTDFSFEIQSQIALIDDMKQASGTSGPAHVFEAVVAADLLLNKYGKTRKFKEGNGEEYLRPRVVLITGSGAGEIIDDNATQLMQWLKDMDACYPVYCVNVQQSQNQRLLSFLTSQSNGKMIPEGKSALLGKFHKLKMNKIISPKSKNVGDMEDIDFLFG